MITDRDHGRIEGFLDAFREEGMGEPVDSWIAEGPEIELSGQDVATGLGPGLVEEMAQRLGLEPANVASALGFLIPRVLDLLTPGGEVPGEELLLSRVDGMLAEVAAGVAGEPMMPVAPAPPSAPLRPAERRPAPATTPAASGPWRRGGLSWLLPLVVLLLLVWWAARRCAPAPQESDASPQATRVEPERSARPEASGLRAGRDVRGTGRRPADAPAASASESASSSAPESEAVPESEADLVEEPDRAGEAEAAAPPFDAASVVDEAQQTAMQAVDDLGPDFTAADLAAVLNRGRIDFAPSSAVISPDARAFLEQAAKAILALPPGTRLEIAGHTDSSGEARRNQRLSQARAQAVRNVLLDFGVPSAMLVPRGYGASRPVAGNDTADGRFRNRRIEFAVME